MNEFKVGLLALVTLAAVVLMSLKITSNQSGFGDYITYRTVLRDASGIFPKTPIKIAGINAGRIKSIHLEGINAMVTFEILERIPIPLGSKLRVNTVGFLGDKYLEIVLAKGEQPIQEGGMILSEDGAGFQKIINDASEVIADVKKISDSLKKTIAPEDSEAPLKTIIRDVKEAIGNVKDATVSLKRIVSGNEEKVNNLIDNIEEFSVRLNDELDKNREGTTLSDVKEVLANAKKISEDLKVLVGNVREGRGTLGKILVEEEIADEVKQTLSGVKKIVNKMNTIRTELAMFSGANTDYGSETFLNMRIYPSPERFYLFGVTTADIGPTRIREFDKTIDGRRTVETWNVRRKNTYRFNVQMGRRIQNWSVRGGVIETSGGFGIDYDIPQINTMFSLELFDYRQDIGPNLRWAADAQIWNVIYGRLALEDLLLKDRSATIFLGIKFTDEDLKSLIGLIL